MQSYLFYAVVFRLKKFILETKERILKTENNFRHTCNIVSQMRWRVMYEPSLATFPRVRLFPRKGCEVSHDVDKRINEYFIMFHIFAYFE